MQPGLLIASPSMQDVFFARTVVLVWHHDDEGSLGVIINRKLDESLENLLAVPEGPPLPEDGPFEVSWGGPVDSRFGTLLLPRPVQDAEGWNFAGIGITRSLEVLRHALTSHTRVVLCLGYAGWGPGQLDEEMGRGSWLWTEPSPQIVFDIPMDERYAYALAQMGLNTDALWMPPVQE